MKQKIKEYIRTWEKRCYHSGIPDEAPAVFEQLNKVPSYRKICFAILKNDVTLETLGFSRPKCRIYTELKRIELTERGVIKWDGQLKLF